MAQTMNDVGSGSSFPLGASVAEGGVNFAVYSKSALKVELLFFDAADSTRPSRVISLDPQRHRTYHYWHAFVPRITIQCRATPRRGGRAVAARLWDLGLQSGPPRFTPCHCRRALTRNSFRVVC
jgi:pullulanase/glycogen debranching enzyme